MVEDKKDLETTRVVKVPSNHQFDRDLLVYKNLIGEPTDTAAIRRAVHDVIQYELSQREKIKDYDGR